MANNIVNLIRKDFCALWSEKTMGLTFVGLLATSAIIASSLTFSSLIFVFFIASSYTLNTFSLEEKFRTERFFASLPVRRRDIVLARYGEIWAIAGAYFVVAYLANAVSILVGKTEVRPIPLGFCATVLVILAFTTSFTFPFYFNLGPAKAKAVIAPFFGILITAAAIITMRPSGGTNQVMKVVSAVRDSPFPRDLPHTLLLMGVAVLLWIMSIPVTVALYSRRDF